jgi:hypothetical protein
MFPVRYELGFISQKMEFVIVTAWLQEIYDLRLTASVFKESNERRTGLSNGKCGQSSRNYCRIVMKIIIIIIMNNASEGGTSSSLKKL